MVSTTKARRESPSAFVPFSVGWGEGGFRAALFVAIRPSLHCKSLRGILSSVFARAGLVALVLASPAWADSDYPAGLFERSPLNDTPAAASSPGQHAKNPPRERARAAATIIASGATRGLNHVKPLPLKLAFIALDMDAAPSTFMSIAVPLQ